METGTRLIKGTVTLTQSRVLTIEEQVTFAGVLQAGHSVSRPKDTYTSSEALSPEPLEAGTAPRHRQAV